MKFLKDNLMTMLALFVFGVVSCNTNLYKGSDNKKKETRDRANDSLKKGDGQEAINIILSEQSPRVRHRISTGNPLDENFEKDFENIAINASQFSLFPMLANAFGVKNGIDTLSFASRITRIDRDKSTQSDKDNITSFFPLLPFPTRENVRDLDMGVAILNIVKSKRESLSMSTLTTSELTMQSMLALTAFAGSIRLADVNRDSSLTNQEIDNISDVDAQDIYLRITKTDLIFSDLMQTKNAAKLHSANRKLEKYLQEIEDAKPSASKGYSVLESRSIAVRAFLKKHAE